MKGGMNPTNTLDEKLEDHDIVGMKDLSHMNTGLSEGEEVIDTKRGEASIGAENIGKENVGEENVGKERAGKANFGRECYEEESAGKDKVRGLGVVSGAWAWTGGWFITYMRRVVREAIGFIRLIRREFGLPMQIVIFSNYFFVKGLAYVIANAVGLPLFKEHLNLPAEAHQRAEAFYRLPWALKGIAGLMADGFAIGGYSKRTTMIACSLFGTAGGLFLSLTPTTQMTSLTASLAIFLVNLQGSFNDLWLEGHYTKAMGEKPATGASLTSFVWLCTTCGMVVASGWVGPALDYVSFNVICVPIVISCFQQLLTMLYPWPFRSWRKDGGLLGEAWSKVKIFRDKLKQEKKIFGCGILLTVIACGAIVLQLIDDPTNLIGFCYALGAATLLLIGLYRTLPGYLFKPLAYLFLARFSVPSIGSVLTYWLTAEPECVPGGPNLSWTFQIAVVSVVGSFFSVLGVILFQRYVSRWTFRQAFWITSVIAVVTSIFDIAMIQRWNIDIFHIPDRAWYFLSDGIIEEVVAMFAFMPSNVLLSRLCPPGIESTVYAILGGVSNFGQTLSKYTGNFLTSYILKIQSTPEAPGGCDFSLLWVAVLLCGSVLPLIPILLTFWLIPNVKMNVHIATPGQHTPGTQDHLKDDDRRIDIDHCADMRDMVNMGDMGLSTAPPTPPSCGSDDWLPRMVLAEIPHPFLGAIPIEVPMPAFHRHQPRGETTHATKRCKQSMSSLDMPDGVIPFFRHCPRDAQWVKNLVHLKKARIWPHHAASSPSRPTAHLPYPQIHHSNPTAHLPPRWAPPPCSKDDSIIDYRAL